MQVACSQVFQYGTCSTVARIALVSSLTTDPANLRGGSPPFEFQKERLTLPLAVLIFVFGVACAAICLWVMRAGYSPTPFGDEWTTLARLAKSTSFPSWLWEQHNEHRYPLLKLTIYADVRWFAAKGIFLFALTFLAMALHWSLWAIFLRKAAALPWSLWMVTAGFFAFCIFNPSQHENLTWAFQWSFVAAFSFASASFIALVWLEKNGQPWRAIVLACISAVLSEFTLASGLLCWPVLVIGSFFLPFRSRQRWALLGVSVLAIFLYLLGYHQPGYHATPLASLRAPDRLIRYSLRYLDHPLSHYVVHTLFALVVLGIAVWIALRYLYRSAATRSAAVALAMPIGFIVLTALMTASGRMNLGLDQSEASRYQTPVMLFWACSFATLAIATWTARPRRMWMLNAFALTAILLPVRDISPLIEQVQARASAVSLAGESLDQNVTDPNVQARLANGMPDIIGGLSLLRGLGDHAGPVENGTAGLIQPGSETCPGAFDEVAPLQRLMPGPAEFRASGWALDSRLRPVSEIVILDGSGKVLAASSLHFARPDVIKAIPGAKGLPGWELYVPVPAGFLGTLHVQGIADGHSCVIAHGTKPVPELAK